MTFTDLSAARATQLRAAAFTYPQVGATREVDPPAGYTAFTRSVPLSAPWPAVCADLLNWQVQSRAGLRVAASCGVQPDALVDMSVGFGRLAVHIPCRVVYVVDESDRCGFAYGTLPGHPESGEERFLLERTDAGITFTVSAFSRPASVLAKLGGPIGRAAQRAMTARYLRAL